MCDHTQWAFVVYILAYLCSRKLTLEIVLVFLRLIESCKYHITLVKFIFMNFQDYGCYFTQMHARELNIHLHVMG